MAKRGRPRHPDILTPREWEVLEFLRQGLSNPEIAERLTITRDGAKYHVSEILSKLGVSSREETAAWRPEQRPWWLAAGVPLALVWRRTTASTVSAVVSGALAVFVVTGVGLVVWGMVRTGGGRGEEFASSGGAGAPEPLSPPAEAGFTPGPALTPPQPMSPPLVRTPGPGEGSWYILDPSSGDAKEFAGYAENLSPDGRRMALASLDRHGLDVLEIETGERTRVFDRLGAASWSPDGEQLAIISIDSAATSSSALYIANADGTGYRKIANVPAGRPFWSPRGNQIAILRQHAEENEARTRIVNWSFEVALIRSDGSDIRTVFPETTVPTREELSVGGLVWDPSGSRFAFVVEGDFRSSEIIFADADTGATRTIARHSTGIRPLAWSPDGRLLAYGATYVDDRFTDYYDRSDDVYIVSTDGSSAPILVANGTQPSWSPDSRYLAFVSGWCRPPETPQYDISIYDTQTAKIRKIAPPEMMILRAQWSPSGEQIAFYLASDDFYAIGDNRGVYTINPDGSGLKRVTSWPDMIGGFRWTPDGSRIYLYPDVHGTCD